MNIKPTLSALALFASFAASDLYAQDTASVGSGLSYTYIDARFADFDNDGVDGDGLRFRGAYELESNFFVLGSVGLFDFDDADADATVLSFGGGYYHPFSEGLDLIGTAEIVRAELDANGNDDSETGFALSGGVRIMLLDQLEGRANVNYVDVADSDTYISIDADYWINEEISAGIGFDIGGDTDEIRLGARWSF